MTTKAGLFAFLIATASTLSASANAAPIVNGGFEQGDFGAWRNSGVYTAVVDESIGLTFSRGNRAALLVGFSTVAPCSFDPWREGCVPWPPVAFPNAPQGGPAVTFAFPSSADLDNAGIMPFRTETRLSRDITASAGQRLTFDWTWLSNDIACPQRQGDLAGVFLRNADTIIGIEGWQVPCTATTAPTETAFRSLGDLGSASFLIPTSGLWTLHISVGNGFEDTFLASGLIVDNFRLEAPEPPILAMLITLILWVGLVRGWSDHGMRQIRGTKFCRPF